MGFNEDEGNWKELLKTVRKALIDIPSKAQPFDIAGEYNDYIAHLLFVGVEDIAETPFIRYNKHNYIVLFNDEPLMPFCIICVNDDVLFGTDAEIRNTFKVPDAFMREGNCIKMINPENTFKGFYILPNGAIAIEYLFLEDGKTKMENLLQLQMPEDDDDDVGTFFDDEEDD